ncbi:MAG: SulP family inorganic anion transporter [Saprospiraceae bacterium]|nr:SulP family inorganic anion transporter [Saprospiraceae bacterium]MDW8483379.1 SulP family inorganic anion transporter [Saprospiraceae bacterium]
MRVKEFFQEQFRNIVEEVKSTLPEDIHFDFRKHVLPLFFPFLAWKHELRNRETLKADLMAGLVGAIIVLPQGIAFAAIAGLPPKYGLYTAIVTPIVAALFGSSRHLVSGPTTAISIVVFASVSQFAAPGSPEYISKVLLLTFLAGVIQLTFALARLGRYISFVSHTVVVGFTAGAAVLIMTNQLRGVLGSPIDNSKGFVGIWQQAFQYLDQVHLPIFAVAAYTLFAAIYVRRHFPRLPHLLVALLFGTILAWGIGGPDAGIPFVAEIPRALPAFSLPNLTDGTYRGLLSSAFAIALLGLIEAVAIGKAIALKSGQSIVANQEFFGQGLSNIIGSFFSCYAGSGSFTRSGVNYEAGARTPMSAIFAALFVLLVVLTLGPFARYLPSPALAGLIMLIGWGLIDFKHIREIRKASKQDNLILGVTFFATLFSELEFAVYIGVLLSLYFFLKKTSQPNIAIMAPDPDHHRHQIINVLRKDVPQCPQLKIIRIDGHLYFGAIDHVSAVLREMRKGPEKYLLILANGINYVDLDGAEWLAREAAFWKKKGGGLYVVRLKIIAQDIMESGGFMDKIGRDHFFTSKTDAIQAIYQKLDVEICKKCPYRVFLECANDPRLPLLNGKKSLERAGEKAMV